MNDEHILLIMHMSVCVCVFFLWLCSLSKLKYLLSNESSFTFIWSVNVYLSWPFIFTQDYEEEEVEASDVSLTKNSQGLGITIAGYVGDKNSGEKRKNRRPFRFKGDVSAFSFYTF